VSDILETKARLRAGLDQHVALESVSASVKCADLSLILASHDALEEALAKADELCRVALPQFNWGASALDGKAIFILNEAPGIIRRALLKEADQ
jgi:hypothetical protein